MIVSDVIKKAFVHSRKLAGLDVRDADDGGLALESPVVVANKALLLLGYFTSFTMKPMPSTTSKVGSSPLHEVNVCSPPEKLALSLSP